MTGPFKERPFPSAMQSVSELHGGEKCEDCDSYYGADGLVWRATDDLWSLIGWGDRGLLCPNCFTKRLTGHDGVPYFVAVDRPTFHKLMAPPEACQLGGHEDIKWTFHGANDPWPNILWPVKFCPECGLSLPATSAAVIPNQILPATLRTGETV